MVYLVPHYYILPRNSYFLKIANIVISEGQKMDLNTYTCIHYTIKRAQGIMQMIFSIYDRKIKMQFWTKSIYEVIIQNFICEAFDRKCVLISICHNIWRKAEWEELKNWRNLSLNPTSHTSPYTLWKSLKNPSVFMSLPTKWDNIGLTSQIYCVLLPTYQSHWHFT